MGSRDHGTMNGNGVHVNTEKHGVSSASLCQSSWIPTRWTARTLRIPPMTLATSDCDEPRAAEC
jgi:hypothetical protein